VQARVCGPPDHQGDEGEFVHNYQNQERSSPARPSLSNLPLKNAASLECQEREPTCRDGQPKGSDTKYQYCRDCFVCRNADRGKARDKHRLHCTKASRRRRSRSNGIAGKVDDSGRDYRRMSSERAKCGDERNEVGKCEQEIGPGSNRKSKRLGYRIKESRPETPQTR